MTYTSGLMADHPFVLRERWDVNPELCGVCSLSRAGHPVVAELPAGGPRAATPITRRPRGAEARSVDSASTGDTAVAAAQALLEELGMVCLGELARTPHRLVQALAELTAGLRAPYDPAVDLGRQFEAASDTPMMVIARGVAFTSVCEHHILPFTGTAAVAYVARPGGRLVGLSKLARLVTGFASAPQMQERLGEQITGAIMEHLAADGAGCLITSVHSCLTLRGARSATAEMVTSHLAGRFLEGPMRQEFLALAERRH